MKNSFVKRILSVFLAVLMAFSVMPLTPITAMAKTSFPKNWRDWNWQSGEIIIDNQLDVYFDDASKNDFYYCKDKKIIRIKHKWVKLIGIKNSKNVLRGKTYDWFKVSAIIDDATKILTKNSNLYLRSYDNVTIGSLYRKRGTPYYYNNDGLGNYPSECIKFYLGSKNVASVSKKSTSASQIKSNAKKGRSTKGTTTSDINATTYNPSVNASVSILSIIDTLSIIKPMVCYAASRTIRIPKGTVLTITEVSRDGKYGKTKYKGITCWVNLNYIRYTAPTITKPDPPSVTLNSAQDIPLGELISVSWSAPADAKYYSVILKDSNGKEVKRYDNVYGNSTSFQSEKAGRFTVEVIARNSEYSSDPGKLGKTISVHDLSTVTFTDDDGTLLGTQRVAWGENAVAPIAPEKKGYTFNNWSDSLYNIKGDKTIKAQYKKTKYTVEFIGYTDEKFQNEEILSRTSVEYGEDATPPEASDIHVPNKNYEFVGWSSDEYKNVYSIDSKEPIKIYAVFAWKNDNLPIACNIVSAVRQSNGYKLVYNLENYPKAVTRGRAIVALKTAEGKMVDMTESSAFSLEKSESEDNIKIFVPCEKAATTAEIFIVNGYTNGNMSDGIPISNKDSSNIQEGKMWSDWQTDEIAETGDNEIESRTEYSFRNIREASANNNTKEGYTCTNSSNPTETSVGGWSGWSWNKIDGFDYRPYGTGKMREVNTQNAARSYNYKTQYNYNRWSNRSSGGSRFGPCAGTWSSTYCGNYQERGWNDSPLNCVYTKYSGQVGGNYSCYGSTSNPWYNQWTRSVVSSTNYGTQYRYRDHTYTYYFYRWDDNDWSSWSADSVSENNKRQVKTRTVYREKKVSAGIEDVSGEERHFSGNAGKEFAGKNITFFVSKYNAISDFTDEYVAQGVIGEDGSYSFDYKLREEPSAQTGDFAIMIGIEGTTEKQIVGKIEAPKPVYTVQFEDANGKVIDEQKVREGDRAIVPEAPQIPGKTFICWNNTCTNVRSDYTSESNTAIKPVYTDNIYTVVFIDWRKQTENNQPTVTIKKYKYGDPLEPPTTENTVHDANGNDQTIETEVKDVDSGYGKGWDYEAGTKVESDMVVTAQYETKTFDVKFYDFDGNVVSDQSVEYDGVADMPALPDGNEDGVDYYDWNIDEEELYGVKENIAVVPNYEFSETVPEPTASVASGAYDGAQTVTLSCADENAVIYYTTDGSEPKDNFDALEYKGPITIDSKTQLNFYASSLGKNDSETETEYYVINNDGVLINMHNNIDDNDSVETYLVDSMQDFDDSVLETEGYTLNGIYYDSDYSHFVMFNKNNNTKGMVDLYAKYVIDSYTVTFAKEDGTVLATQKVNYLDSATPPEVADEGTKICVGWDSEDYDNVTSDMTIHPVFKEKSEIVNVSFDRDKYQMNSDSTYQINADINAGDDYDDLNDAVVWSSDNEDVATVDNTGLVTAHKAGSAKIYAYAADGFNSACCEITVVPSINSSIVLNNLSTLNIDSEGYLRRIPLDGSNTVENIASQFKNSTDLLTFTNSKGKVLAVSDKVGTNTVISLKNGDKNLDSVTVIMTGDITCDGKVSNRDVSYAARVILKRQTADAVQLRAIDVNGDGKVNNRDVAMLSRYLVGKENIKN